MAAVVQVIEIALVGIGLALKRDVAVGVTAHRQPDNPLHEIGHVEEDEQHLPLLCRVDALVVDELVAQVHSMMYKQDSQQIDCRESMKGQYRSPHDFHCCKVTTLFAIIHPDESSTIGNYEPKN